MVFHFQRHYIETIKTCNDISSVMQAGGQQFTCSGNNCLFEHMQQKQTSFSCGLIVLTQNTTVKFRHRTSQIFSGIFKVSPIPQSNCWLEIIFWLIWRAFAIGFDQIIVWINVFHILMVHHFLSTNPYKMSIFDRLLTCRIFLTNCSHLLTKTQEKKFLRMCFWSK